MILIFWLNFYFQYHELPELIIVFSRKFNILPQKYFCTLFDKTARLLLARIKLNLGYLIWSIFFYLKLIWGRKVKVFRRGNTMEKSLFPNCFKNFFIFLQSSETSPAGCDFSLIENRGCNSICHMFFHESHQSRAFVHFYFWFSSADADLAQVWASRQRWARMTLKAWTEVINSL